MIETLKQTRQVRIEYLERIRNTTYKSGMGESKASVIAALEDSIADLDVLIGDREGKACQIKN